MTPSLACHDRMDAAFAEPKGGADSAQHNASRGHMAHLTDGLFGCLCEALALATSNNFGPCYRVVRGTGRQSTGASPRPVSYAASHTVRVSMRTMARATRRALGIGLHDVSALGSAVSGVVEIGSCEQVCRPDAAPVVALVKNEQRGFTEFMLPRQAVSAKRSASTAANTELAVSFVVDGGRPNPARPQLRHVLRHRTGFVDLGPKSRQRLLIHGTSCVLWVKRPGRCQSTRGAPDYAMATGPR